MKSLGRVEIEGTITSSNLKSKLSFEISKFKIRISSGDKELSLTFNKPILELDVNSRIKAKLSIIDYAKLSWLLVKLSRELRKKELTLIAKTHGKTFLVVGRKGI